MRHWKVSHLTLLLFVIGESLAVALIWRQGFPFFQRLNLQ